MAGHRRGPRPAQHPCRPDLPRRPWGGRFRGVSDRLPRSAPVRGRGLAADVAVLHRPETGPPIPAGAILAMEDGFETRLVGRGGGERGGAEQQGEESADHGFSAGVWSGEKSGRHPERSFAVGAGRWAKRSRGTSHYLRAEAVGGKHGSHDAAEGEEAGGFWVGKFTALASGRSVFTSSLKMPSRKRVGGWALGGRASAAPG